MRSDKIMYLKWILNELNQGLELNTFTKNIYSPIYFEEILSKDTGKIGQIDRILVAAEIYRWVMGGKWRLLDLEHLIKDSHEYEEFKKKDIKKDIKHLIDEQELLNPDVLKMCLILTGLSSEIIESAKYVIQKRYLYTGSSSKLWSAIGYYNMKDKSIHVSTGGGRKDNKVVFPLEDIIETATHELGHHIYISMISGRFKTPKGIIRKIRSLIKGIRSSRSEYDHKQWIKFYKKDYSNEWDTNKAIQIIPKNVYIRYGIENELFAQAISGKTTISKKKRKELIDLINQSCQVC